MPKGVVITMKPVSLADDAGMSPEEIQQKECSGTIRILDGPHKGELGYFAEVGRCCLKRVGEEVNFDIKQSGQDGKLRISLNNC